MVPGTRKLLHVFPSFAVGGAQMRFAQLANHFGPAYQHMVVALDGNTAASSLLDSALQVGFPAITLARGGSPATLFGNAVRTARALRRLQPDLLVTSNWGSIEWGFGAQLTATPHLHMEDGFGPEERNRQIPRRVLIRRLALRRCRVMLPSQRLLAIATTVWRLPPSRLAHVPNGVDLARFAATKLPSPWPHGEGPVIGTVAALRAEKNLARLIRAFAQIRAHRPCRLAIVGDGPDRANLTSLAADLGLSADIVFTGHLAQPEQALRHMDIFALSSDTEQMPLSLLEAMASNLPVASTDVGDVKSMLPTAQAPYVTPLDDTKLAEALQTLVADPTLRSQLGTENRHRAETTFSQAQMFAAWHHLWSGRMPP
jgi:glycosyltransferase involved in cell wall biosynthesis